MNSSLSSFNLCGEKNSLPSAHRAKQVGSHITKSATEELQTGDFAVIGKDITEQAITSLPSGSGCGAGERIVSIPRRTLVLARSDIPATL